MAKRARGHDEVSAKWFDVLEETAVLSDFDGPFIATHHGAFHCDEIVAISMLKSLPEYQNLPVVRTRDPKVIERATIVVDVGSVYEPENWRFDHHQAPFQDTYPGRTIRLSSAGLIYLHFGKQVIEAISGEKVSDAVVTKVYDNFILEVDAIDNGVEAAKEMKYRIHTGLSSRVRRLNPSWMENNTPAMENERFKEGLIVCAQELLDQINGVVKIWLPARQTVADAYGEGGEEVIVMPRHCPWQEHLFELEAKPIAKYVLFQDTRGGWRVQAVPREIGSFENRLPLPKPWRGLRDEELSQLSGVPGCVFVHASGFIGGNLTKEGAIAMANKACQFME
eukprot:GEMP01042715.1.p1 GENE.GEMP01042715.1~~GEMP01042715.1.p1  ORF type:complete len:337 (+),score=85.50 GEMP01042715.1:71-1081(+)